MGRTVSGLVTWGGTYLGAIGPFPVSVPWWSEVEPVVAHLREVLDVLVFVLRLLLVEGDPAAVIRAALRSAQARGSSYG